MRLSPKERGVHAASAWTAKGALDYPDAPVPYGRLCGVNAALRSRNYSVEPIPLDHRDTMNTEKTKASLVDRRSLIGGFLEPTRSLGFLCVHRVSVVFFPVPTE